MKKIIWLIGFCLLLLPNFVYASGSTTISLDNYFYAHANMPGTYPLKDKYGSATIYGDTAEDDGIIKQIIFNYTVGLSANDYVKVTTREGEVFTIKVAAGAQNIALGNSKTKSFKADLIKTTYTENYVTLDSTTVDDTGSDMNIYYNYNKQPPTQAGSLGPGNASPSPTATPAATPAATPKPTATPSPTATPIYDLQPYKAGGKVVWSNPLINTDYVEVYKDGVKLATYTDRFIATHPLEGNGVYVIKAISKQGNLIGQGTLNVTDSTDSPVPTPIPTDPPGNPEDPEEEPCAAGCQNIKDALECPEFDQYLGKWADMIRGTYPPPPDWNNVAAIMRDTIVPAMGQEIVNRAPEIADIIADEFESRETPVQPPPPIPSFDPVVPKFNDSPNAINESLDSNVPNFSPDYTESKPFTIPDPLDVEFSNEDKGYGYKEPDNSAPVYEQTEAAASAAPDYEQQKVEDWTYPHYKQKLTWSEDTKAYEVENVVVDQPDRTYNYPATPTGSAAPDYQSGGGVPDNADYNFSEDNQIPDYQGGE